MLSCLQISGHKSVIYHVYISIVCGTDHGADGTALYWKMLFCMLGVNLTLVRYKGLLDRNCQNSLTLIRVFWQPDSTRFRVSFPLKNTLTISSSFTRGNQPYDSSSSSSARRTVVINVTIVGVPIFIVSIHKCPV